MSYLISPFNSTWKIYVLTIHIDPSEIKKSHNRQTLVHKVTAQHYLWTLSHHVSLKKGQSLFLRSYYLWRISYIAHGSRSAPLVNWNLVSRGVGVRFLSERWALVRIGGLCARYGGECLDRLVAIQMFCGEERHVRPQKIFLHCPHCQTSLKHNVIQKDMLVCLNLGPAPNTRWHVTGNHFWVIWSIKHLSA